MIAEQKKQEPNFKIGVLGCIGGLFLQLIVGSLYQWGIISIYITSYFKMMDNTLTLEQTSIASPIMMICSGITIALGLRLAKTYHPLIVLTLVAFLQALSIFISSYMTNFWLFVLFYGIIFGLLTGFAFMIPIFQCNKYLVGRKMFVNGLILIGAGLGSVVFGLFSYSFLNPNEISPLNGYYLGTSEVQDIALKLPTLMKWLSLLYLVIGLLGTLMVAPVALRNREIEIENQKRSKQQQEQHEASKKATNYKIQINLKFQIEHQVQTNLENHKNNENPQNHEKKKHQDDHKHQRKHMHEANSIGEAMKSRVFWISNLIFLMSTAGVFLINSNYKTYVKAYIHDDKFLTTIGVIGAVGNGCTRFLWNFLFNKTGFKTVLLTILALLIIVFATIRLTVTNQSAYLFEVFVVNCCLGGLLVATPTGLQSIFGITTGTKIYAVYMVNFGLANLIAWVYISQLSNVIGFNNVIYICLFMVVVDIPVIAMMKFQGPWKNDTSQLEFYIKSQLEKAEKERVANQHSNQHKGEEHPSQVMIIMPLIMLPKDQVHFKVSESTVSHIPSLSSHKISRKILPQIEKKESISILNLTSLKMIKESPQSPKNVQGNKAYNTVIVSKQNSDALVEANTVIATE